MTAQSTDLQTLLQQCEELQRKITRFSVVEQELINTRNSVDEEIERLRQSAEARAGAAAPIGETPAPTPN
jgi:prephenate dehydratase